MIEPPNLLAHRAKQCFAAGCLMVFGTTLYLVLRPNIVGLKADDYIRGANSSTGTQPNTERSRDLFKTSLVVLAGKPSMKFRVHTIASPAGKQFGQTSAVDVDRDGDIDFITGQQSGQVCWYENPGHQAEWAQHIIGEQVDTDVGGVAFDVDGDGWVDQVSGGTWFRNPGTKRANQYWARHDNGAIPTHDNVAADIDGDGKLDLVSLIDKLGVFWYRIPSDATRPWIQTKLIGPTDPPCHGGLAVGDIDGDGDQDVSRLDRWFENTNGIGDIWVERKSFDFGKVGPWGLQTKAEIVDIDGDGDNDLVQAEGDVLDGRVAWFENLDGRGRAWTRHEIKGEGHQQDFHSLSIADFDGDGDVDVFSGGGPLTMGEHVWFIWENRVSLGDGFCEHVIARGVRTHESVAADVDGDGDIDLLTKPWRGNRHVFAENKTR